MSITHETSPGSGTAWSFWFGNYHDTPPEPPPEAMIIARRWFGIQGEGHITGMTAGRDLRVGALYRGYASLAALLADTRADNANTNHLTGELFISTISYGNATFLGGQMIGQPMPDGKNGLWFVPAILTWRLRT